MNSKTKCHPSLDLFGDHALARNTDPETSHEAARSVNVTKREKEVVDALEKLKWSGGNNYEIGKIAGIRLQSVTPRIKPLRKKGLVTKRLIGIDPKTQKPKYLTRPGETNSPSTVWFLKEYA